MSTKQHPLIREAIRIVGSQKKLAAAICMSQQTISRLLNQERAVTVDEAVRIESATQGKIKFQEFGLIAHAALEERTPNTRPQDSLLAQDNGETGESTEQGSAVCAVGSTGKSDFAQVDQVVAAAGRGKRRRRAALSSSDAALNTRTEAVR